MDYATFASVLTVVAFLTFLGIVFWAYSRGRRADFDAAARLPFVLPDEAGEQPAAGEKQQ
ncbi:MAG: CcoQ/FixQ family Cbb3-type cytochrome c oxidase assembly chaperone [Burkholderiales bacterium]|nr:MAG: CcoQ/FixQ family Cbb3-type cytochrome c oxidase assembly chaperone [Burkholderiales bacterium]